ncbi:MAG: hypothetical protein B6D37_14565 [Sphingobacteriales bacterium UTBCD1]|jgi:hypothetical protein|nr:MAG: hypothetical protein B6D37_14565 [Sphingobacteriales bacterium UTBCD1]
MKQILLFVLLLTVSIDFLSCSTDPNAINDPSTANGIFQYKVNGTPVTIRNVDVTSLEYVFFAKHLPGVALPQTTYILNAQKGANIAWVVEIETDSLSLKNYRYDSVSLGASWANGVMTNNGMQSGVIYNGDYFSINITSYSNGLISGNFTGKLTPLGILGGGGPDYSLRGTTIITDGQFKNIKCIY